VSWGYPPSVRPYDYSMSHIDTVPACDRRRDRRMDGRFTTASAALCIVSYADAL